MENYEISMFRKTRDKGFAKVDFFKDGFTNGFLLNFLPKQMMPEHYHPSSQLFFHVLQGGGTFISDGKQTEIREGTIIHVHGTEKIGFVNANEDTTIYVIRCLIEE
ncbi:cupin domain-containing protein [Neobacillus sp. MM2021_6]|uniref:cupin domain-containing protein n=1 Tax=Bacillaceae TaxID=186817 RepID=UPI001407338A|nr:MULTISPECIES: cupin domain-containing protein [Bacillaceae]MBO0960692.1 cupin domain-containing protein [Neobacillus sp. MM2021_6]NHC18414.1 cupin domain-containing protein [Bacillus sp. MM2020_4]WML38470.1 cupin domain-containing protein [Neobacillus sp. OS1-2]